MADISGKARVWWGRKAQSKRSKLKCPLGLVGTVRQAP